MNSVKCHEGLQRLADAFGNNLSTDKVNAYHDIFQNINGTDWIRACDKARMVCDKFPSPKMLNEILIEARAWKRGANPLVLRVFDCPKCHMSFVFNPQDKGDVIQCPGQFYNTDDVQVCNMTFDRRYLTQNSVEA